MKFKKKKKFLSICMVPYCCLLSPWVQLWEMELVGDAGSLLQTQGTKDGDKRLLWGWQSVPMALCHPPGAVGCRPTSTAQDFNKKHIIVSNALSGLHYRPGASLAVPCDFLSDEPYLLSKRSHLNSINLSKPPRLGASQPGAGAGSTAGLCSPTAEEGL